MQIPAIATIGLLISIIMLATLAMILMMFIRRLKRDLAAKDALLGEHIEYRSKAENLYHVCQLQEEELDRLRALIERHNIDY
ncbi:hypothetical protein GSG79_004250 [Escherichia coli]|jgi:predicted Holliday junction resolvase-like endonuclease|nr:hypothetical protein [Escherichia coli]EGN2600667.1 hypothetical protein [Salmonella enterica]